MVHIDDTRLAGNPGFTVWPAISSGNDDTRANGTEWFLSSMAAEEANGTGTDHRIGVWGLTNTASLDTAHPNVALRNAIVNVSQYGVPPASQQRPGSTPLRTCLNNTSCRRRSATAAGSGSSNRPRSRRTTSRFSRWIRTTPACSR